MIPQITEVNFPQYATLHQATCSFAEMGDRTISTQVRIDGDIVPDFSGWELRFKGERFVLPVREPQAAKDNTTRNSLVDLTFYSWPTLQMKRYFFFNLPSVTAGVAIPDQYVASVNLPITSFVQLFNGVLQYYFGSTIRMELFDQEYDTNPVAIEINYSHIWDVLTKFYELYGYRWKIVEENGAYVIKVNFPADAINDHDFEYGYQGGLLRFERQVQDDNINNVLLGRGGEKNLPFRYFKRYTGSAERPDTFPDDPDALYELKDIYFDRLRDSNFRWYVRGWMQNSNRDRAWENAGYSYPQYAESECPSASLFAFRNGKTDTSFQPVEYVKDDDSIEKYGERWGAVENQDEIYPTIQGLSRDGVGRIDETVAVSEILTDDIDAAAHNAVTENIIEGRKDMFDSIEANSTKSTTFVGEPFEIPTGKTGNLALTASDNGDPYFVIAGQGYRESTKANLRVSGYTLRAKNEETGEIVSGSGIPAGTYRYVAEITVANNNDGLIWITYGFNGIKLVLSDEDAEAWKPTFDVWVKNIWNTQRAQGESDQAYSERVWLPILGDRVGNEAKLVFSTGPMSISQDYEFQLAAYPVPDQSKSFKGVPSEWKITLRKSDAEFDATGLFIPNAKTGGQPQAGDKFFFAGIDMPNMYVTEAEKRLSVNKESQLDKTSSVNPTWAITLDKVRVHTLEDGEYGQTLAERLSAGCTVRTTDPRFTPGEVLVLYVQSLTYSWNEGDQVPNIEVVLSDKIISTVNPIQKLSGDVSFIRESYVRSSELEATIRRVASPMFLKKTGEEDSSNSPTSFASALSSKNFRQGDIGGAGWGHYEDGDGDSVLELDKLVVRKEMRVNSLVANQIAYVGGKQVISAASIECKQVIENESSYTCYFEQRQGTVANLFVVGDIVLGQTFDPENVETRYYRCQVSAVGPDHIVLSKSGKDGDGAPEKGDTIVQYGHVSNVNRQFVIVRDVIGGGYERMISGLNSTLTDGNEYYYAGHATGAGPRWFVGSRTGEYAEWINGRLNIKGSLVVRNADGSYQAMTDYMAAVNTAMGELQAQIDGQIQSWSGAVAPMPEKDEQGQVDPSTANYPANQWTTDAERLKHFGDIYVDDTTGQGWRYTRLPNEGAFYWMRITDAELAQALSDIQALQEDVAGLNYLKVATNNGTLVQGGLVLTSMMQLGQVENGVYKVYSGINGVLDQTMQDPTRSIAAWFGGPMVDHETQPSEESYARTLFRHDGSGYLASGRIHWTPTGAGGIPGISWTGNQVVIDGDVKLSSVSGDTVTSMLTLLRQINDWFGEDADGNIYVKRKLEGGALVARNFYSYGAVTAGGVGSGGGGGSVDLDRVWESLTNNTDKPDVKINTAHIPDVASVYGYLKGITDGMVTAALGYVPFDEDDFTGANIKTTLGISDWALAANKPSYSFSEIGNTPTTLAGYGIADAKFSSAGVADKIRITLGANYHDVLTAHQSLSGYATESWVGQQGFITKAVNDLTNYYLKSQTYTKTEVDNLIGAINQFHYEVYPSTSSVTNPKSNVLYLIGPTGSGADKYEEYVYPNATAGWTKIGDTSIDLSPYLTIAAAQATYQPIISDLSTIRSMANEGHTVYGYFTNGVLGLSHIPDDDRLSYVDPEAGEEITIDDPGTTGTVLWGAESANNVALDVNGVSKTLVKQAAIDGVYSSISSLSALIGTKQDYISDLSSIRNKATLGATAYGWGDHRQAGYLTSVPIASASTLGLIRIGDGLAIDGSGIVSVTGQTQGTVTRVDVGGAQYSPDANGIVGLPAYPVIPTQVSAFTNDAGYLTGITGTMVVTALGYTPFNSESFTKANIQSTLGISDWALDQTKPSYAFSEITGTASESQIPSLSYTKITGLGTAATRGVATTIGPSVTNLVPGSLLYSVLGDAYDSTNTVKDFVNSSIATATATFRGTNDSAATEADFLAWANALTHDLNDYVFWKTADSVGNVVYKRYKYNGASWAFEYDLNNSSFTAAQWAAINSGITGQLVNTFNAKYDKPAGGIPKTDLASAVQTSLGKADTALQSHQTIYGLTIKNSAGTDVLSYNPASAAGALTLTKAMVGLGNVENFVYNVPTGAEQTYTYPV